jgi:hypothetical protein
MHQKTERKHTEYLILLLIATVVGSMFVPVLNMVANDDAIAPAIYTDGTLQDSTRHPEPDLLLTQEPEAEEAPPVCHPTDLVALPRTEAQTSSPQEQRIVVGGRETSDFP